MKPKTTLTAAQKRLLARTELAPAMIAFTLGAKRSRAWNRLVSRSIAEFGDCKGSHTSGIYGEHFPEARKTQLRTLAHGVTLANDIGWNARPKRILLSTMRALRLAVHARDGSGFYG